MSSDQHKPSDSSANEDVLSALALGLTPADPPADARTRLVAALHGRERYSLYAKEIASAFGVSADAALEALHAIDRPNAWQEGLLPGARMIVTPALRDAMVVIACLPEKTVIPRHAHSGREITFVLDGLLIEDGSRACGPGTLIDAREGSQHELAVGAGAECLVVFHPALA